MDREGGKPHAPARGRARSASSTRCHLPSTFALSCGGTGVLSRGDRGRMSSTKTWMQSSSRTLFGIGRKVRLNSTMCGAAGATKVGAVSSRSGRHGSGRVDDLAHPPDACPGGGSGGVTFYLNSSRQCSLPAGSVTGRMSLMCHRGVRTGGRWRWLPGTSSSLGDKRKWCKVNG